MIALDTNVLLYACDRADSRRQQIAINLVARSGSSPRCSGPRQPFKLSVEAPKYSAAGKFLGKLHLNL